MLNLPHSIVPWKLQKSSLRFVLVGNKVDQLPIDGSNYYSRWTDALSNAFTTTTGISKSDIIFTTVISALSGYGMNSLLTFLLSARCNAFSGPAYIVGCSNVGKSSLFNRLLMSDFCKSEARESIHRATVSYWPGTTVGLLKFPISRMSYVKHALRSESRYQWNTKVTSNPPSKPVEMYGFGVIPDSDPGISFSPSSIDDRVDLARNRFQDLSEMPVYKFSPEAASDNCINETNMDFRTMLAKELHAPVDLDTCPRNQQFENGERLLIGGTLDPRLYNSRAWCHDTPGLANPQETANYLTPAQFEEYYSVKVNKGYSLKRKKPPFVLPRTFVVRPGLTMFLGVLGRLDVLEAPGTLYLTTHSRLPVHLVETSDVENYLTDYSKYLSHGDFSFLSNMPTSFELRAYQLPPMTGCAIEPLDPSGLEASVADVVLSSAGWISIAGCRRTDVLTSESVNKADERKNILLYAWTPGGLGIHLRKPALLPFAVQRRGRRLGFLREFSGTNLEQIRPKNKSSHKLGK